MAVPDASPRLARGDYDDEIAFSAEVVGLTPPASEFNVLGKLWNARFTSHIALKDVRVAPLCRTYPPRIDADRCLHASRRL